MNFEPTTFEKQFFAGRDPKEGIYPRIRQRRAADRVLTSVARKRLDDKDFAIPETRSYPIDTLNRARNALARASQFAPREIEKRVRRAVHKRWPEIDMLEYREDETA